MIPIYDPYKDFTFEEFQKLSWLRRKTTMYKGYLRHATNTHRHRFPRLWAAREVFWDHFPTVFDFWYHVQRKGGQQQ